MPNTKKVNYAVGNVEILEILVGTEFVGKHKDNVSKFTGMIQQEDTFDYNIIGVVYNGEFYVTHYNQQTRDSQEQEQNLMKRLEGDIKWLVGESNLMEKEYAESVLIRYTHTEVKMYNEHGTMIDYRGLN